MDKRIVLLLAVVALVLSGCQTTPAAQQPVAANSPQVVNVSPNWEYIGLDRLGSIPENQVLIGNAIWNWEQAHPDRRIVSLQIDYRQADYLQPWIFGIMIYSETR